MQLSIIKTERNLNLMIRLTIKQAIAYLTDEFVKMNPKESDKVIRLYVDSLNEMNTIELRTELEKVSNGLMTLKGSREATNISFAPKETQGTYKEAELIVGSIERFVGKEGLTYECGVYCKKVPVKKDTEKK